MGIDDPDTVDSCGIDPATGVPTLVVIDANDWSDPVGHMNALQRKVINYMGFIRTGQLLKELPEAAGLRPRINVFQRFEPPENMMPLLYGLGQQFAAIGVDFDYGPLADGYEKP